MKLGIKIKEWTKNICRQFHADLYEKSFAKLIQIQQSHKNMLTSFSMKKRQKRNIVCVTMETTAVAPASAVLSCHGVSSDGCESADFNTDCAISGASSSILLANPRYVSAQGADPWQQQPLLP